MTYKTRYTRRRQALLSDAAICQENRELFRQFFDQLEYKLKRINGLRDLDEPCYNTLGGYIYKLRNANSWLNNKPWASLTRADIKKVYDDLEDGRIKTRKGTRFEDRRGYYTKIFKGRPFRLAGKSELAREIIEFPVHDRKPVRFVTEETFRSIVSVVSKPHHLFLLWLAWDIGENINTLLQLNNEDLVLQQNRHTKDYEYLVALPKQKLKRSRRDRSEITIYRETVHYGRMVLADLRLGEPIFPFGYRQASKVLASAVRRSEARALPSNDPVRWKDLRSGMACHLLKIGWTRDEVNARLGHSPNSSALDSYINYLALDRDRPKARVHETTVDTLTEEIKTLKQQALITGARLAKQEETNRALTDELVGTRNEIAEVRRTLLKVARVVQ